MPITSKKDSSNDLTVFIARGELEFEEIMIHVETFYQESPTQNVLWDLTGAKVWQLTSKDVEKIAGFAPRFGESRKGGKTAFVVSESFAYNLSKAFAAFTELDNPDISVKIFEPKEAAREWIGKNE